MFALTAATKFAKKFAPPAGAPQHKFPRPPVGSAREASQTLYHALTKRVKIFVLILPMTFRL